MSDELLIQEARRRGLLPPEPAPAQPAAAGMSDDELLLAEARRRGIIPAEEPSPVRRLLSAAGDVASSAYQGAKDFVTGDDRREFDIPEVPGQLVPGFGEIKSKMALGQSPEAQADIFRSAFPNAPVRQDKFGNYMANLGGKDYYLNRPGLSGQDVDDFTTQALMMAPFVGGGARVGAAVGGVIGRIAGAGAGGGAASIVQDHAAREAGSEQPVSLPRAAGNALTAGIFEGGAPLVSAIFRRMFPNPELVDRTTGTLTDAGKAALAKVGIDPAEVTDEFAREFAKMAKDAARPSEAAVAASGQSLPVPVPMTRGDVSRMASDQMFENLAEKGAYGRVPETVMRSTRDAQQDALRANVPAIQSRLAGGQPNITAPGEAGAILQSSLDDMARAGKAEVNAAYDAARAAPAGLPQKEVQGLRYFVGAGDVAERLPFAPKAQARLEALDKITEAPNGSVLVKNLFDWRRTTTTLARESTDPTEGAALREMVKRFDEAIPEMVKRDLMDGDQEAVNLWTTAIKLRKEWGAKFQGDDLIEGLLEREPRSGKLQLKVSPEQASNFIFGLSDTGFVNKGNLMRDLRRVRGMVGEGSAEWNAIREEAFLRLAKSAEGPYSRSVDAREFSGAKFASALDVAMKRNPELMLTLFDPKEMALLKQFKDVALRTTTVTRGGDNFSNTMPAAANIVQKMAGAGFVGDKAKAALLAVIPGASNLIYGVKAVGAAGGGVAKRQVPPGLAGAFGAAGYGAITN